MVSIHVLEGDKPISFELSGGETTVGRHQDSGIVLSSAAVSGRHAKITGQGSAWFIEDVGSRNGTFVNGQKVQQPVQLHHNDRIVMGNLVLAFVDSAQAAAALPVTRKPSSHAPPVGKITGTVDFAEPDVDESMILGALKPAGRFGLLDAQPEAKLKAVLEISTALAGTLDLRSLLPKILDTLLSVFPRADRGCILLKDEATGRMVPRAFKHRRGDEDASVRLSRTIINKVLTEKTGILSADASRDMRLAASQSIADLRIRSMMCVPMIGLDGNPAGIISLDSQNPLGQFQQEDLDLLMAVAGQAALSYESARLLASFMVKQKQDNEMQIARDVQLALLPSTLPRADGYEFFASYDSAQAVGGDYYDCFQLEGGKICLAFGDVAGKGVPGALIMSRISSAVQSTVQFQSDVAEAAVAINNHMSHHAVAGRFVTFVLVMLDPRTHEMKFVNAGHMSPLLRKADGQVIEFDEENSGPPIGVVDDYPYEAETYSLQPGDTIVIITDGVDEAMNPAGELYTKERVVEFVKNASPKADELGKALLADVRRHANGRPQNDDITIMAFGRNAT
jgi:sigma-B regulation protein RsbU (phosphoserine phosphatase)